MKRSAIFSRFFFFAGLICLLLLAARPLLAAPADGVVGEGTRGSCDGNALEAAVTAGGTVTFNCGGAHTILANTMVILAGNTVVVDGGGLIAISGEDLRQLFIVNEGASLTLIDVTLEDGSWPGRGGAIISYGATALTNAVVRSSLTECLVCDGSDGLGGAIAVEGSGTLTVNASRLSNNQANGAGGAIALYGGSATILNSTIDGNFTPGFGGAIWMNEGTTLTLSDSLVVTNTAGYANAGVGGGLYNRGTATIERTTFRANQANDAGALHTTGAGSALTVRQSTFSTNDAFASGGALQLFGGAVLLENSTVSGNTAHNVAGGIRLATPGGGGATLLHHVTLFNNVVTNFDNVTSNSNLHLDAESEPPQLQHSAITGAAAGDNCYLGVNPVSLGYNVAGDASCALTATGDQQSVALLLAPLADNGGPTQTHLPFTGSPVVDAVPAAACLLATDQRAMARPQGPQCDAGAVEEVPTVAPPLPVNANQTFFLGKLLIRPFNFPIFALKPDIEATQLEITQGIQEADGLGVTLVANKTTFVRFHVEKGGFGADPVVGARLWRIVGGQRVGDPILPSARPGLVRFLPFRITGEAYVVDPTVTVRSTPDRNSLTDSFFFRLPAAWITAGSLTIEAEVNPTSLPYAVEEATRSNNTLRTSFSFVSTPSMVLRLFAVPWRAGGVTYTPSETQLREVEDWIRRAYPISRLIVKRDVEDMTNLNRIPTCDEVNGRLFWDNLFLKWAGIDPVPTRYFGLVVDGPSGAPTMRGCSADIPSFIASGPTGTPSDHTFSNWDQDNDGQTFGDWYTGHELAHTWGRRHVTCRGDEAVPDMAYPMGESGSIGRLSGQNKYWGFDIYLRGPVVYPPTWKDIMTYCDNQWISAYTYEAIRNRLVSENDALLQTVAAAPQLDDYLVVEGVLTASVPSAALTQLYRLTAPLVLALTADGGYAIRLVDGGGAELARYPFSPRTGSEELEAGQPQLVMEQVPFVAGTAQVQIVKGAVLLASRAVSANAPQVTVSAPAGGEVIDGNGLAVSWSAFDADADALVATVLLSRDGGVTWSPLRLHLADSSVVIPLEELAATTQGKIRVIVSDGVNSGQGDSAGAFTVPNQLPVAHINTPAQGEPIGYGQVTAFTGAATDNEDAALPDEAFIWSSDLDGVLGAGPALEAALATVGSHVITLQVTDSGGAIGTESRTVVVSNDVMAAEAQVVAAPPATNFVAEVGNTAVQSQLLALRNPAGDALDWQATSDAAWLTVVPAAGVTPADPAMQVVASGLPAGDYTGVITVAAGALPAQLIRVTLTVRSEVAAVQEKTYLPFIAR